MQIKANGRSAVIIAAGLLAIWVSPVHACDTSGCGRIVLAQASEAEAAPAAEAEQPATRPKSRHSRHSSRKADKAKAGSASKKEAGLSGAEKPADAAASPDSSKSPGRKDGVTPAVANANAQMMAPAAPGTSPQSFTDKGPATAGSTTPAAADAPPAGDQAAMAPPTTTADADNQVVAPDELNELDRAAADKPAPKVLRPTAASAQASVGSEDTWNQTSLIGKIFIAVGGLLTLASAARMFIA